MKKSIYFTIALLLSKASYAGLITHTDYTAGNVITAAGQNTNENAVFNEFNGNINSANIATGGVSSTNILDGTILNADLNSTLQSTFTTVNSMQSYRRPVLKDISTTAIDIENNTGTLNETCVFFLDGRRCVTEDTSSTSVNRRFIITENATNSGTKNSGLFATSSKANNTNYSLYAWEVSDNSTDFVIVGTTVNPIQANYSNLNTMLGTGKWVHIGDIRNGDNSNTGDGILDFTQTGNVTIFNNALTGGATARVPTGILLSSGATVGSSTYTFVAGSTNNNLFSNWTMVYYTTAVSGGTARSIQVTNVNGTKFRYSVGSDTQLVSMTPPVPIGSGSAIAMSGNGNIDITLSGFIDNTLGVGSNPQL